MSPPRHAESHQKRIAEIHVLRTRSHKLREDSGRLCGYGQNLRVECRQISTLIMWLYESGILRR